MVLPWLHYEELCNLCWSSKGTPEACIALVLSIAVAFRIVGGSDISCLDFGRKMRGMNCRCSEVISRATGDAPSLCFPAASLAIQWCASSSGGLPPEAHH